MIINEKIFQQIIFSELRISDEHVLFYITVLEIK